MCHTECFSNMHPIGISIDVVKFECIIKPYVAEFHFTKYWLRRGTPSISNLFIGGIIYHTCNKLLYVCYKITEMHSLFKIIKKNISHSIWGRARYSRPRSGYLFSEKPSLRNFFRKYNVIGFFIAL